MEAKDSQHNHTAGQAPRLSRGRNRGRYLVIAVLLMLIGAAVMLYPKMTDLRYAWAQWRLEASVADAQGGGVSLPEGAVALMEIPAIRLRAYVLEGTSRSVLAEGPGHYPGTPLPGESGNSAIAGHRTMYGHPFHDLDLLEAGDEILTSTADCTAVYRVSRVVVVYPGQTEVVAQTDDDRLTLTACHPKGSASRRLVVMAQRTE